MSHELAQTLPIPLISKDDYERITSQWITQLNQDDGNSKLDKFFFKDGSKLTAVRFDLDTILYLVSSEGTTTIKARFCIQDGDDDERLFNVVLYGVDANGITTSAYFLGTPYSPDLETPGLPQCQIPSSLGNIWIQNWVDNDVFVAKERFKTIYGYLQGYNFELSDFIDSAFSADYVGLSVTLALHELFRPYETDPYAPTFTFNLVLQGLIKEDGDGTSEKVADADGLYDISAPSPPY
ncbi:hypothetical protein SIO70_01890 [Chitinophaga sancti]|uniref:hypothetical protein n=1 Tax=Chitinophaga sancti TaxID=1004 RepID=UPI002A755CDD|nr:hypothetical protein [Chitinophaga sancti]WPQ63614.1 hypothetical protein SIO70_01890 [Chitinophaga sancti]